MAQRGGRGGSRGQEMADDEARVPMQAVLLADSFTQKFRPITMERPKVLLPLINVPMIDYTLEWLASAGVEEVYVFCCAHAKQVIDYLEKENSRWKSQPNFTITCLQSDDSVSVGDALRSIDQRNVISGDFVLVRGDTVSNMPLKQVIHEHKARRTKDKLAVMTMVIKRAKPSPLTMQTRLGNDQLVLAIDPDTKQLLHYGTAGKSVALETSLLTDRPGLQLHVDMQDCHVDICSPEVLMLFTDNFDYQQMRKHFVRGLLSDEVMGNKIYTFEISEDYAARIDNFRAYDVISKDILHRWTYPIVPDIPFSDMQGVVSLDRCNKYREQGISVARTAVIGENTFIGQGTVIGNYSSISNSVIGRGCRIGDNVTVTGSYIWDNVTIEDNVQIQESVLCNDAIVRYGAKLEPGVVLSFKVVIGRSFTVPKYSKISLVPEPTEQDSSDEELEYADDSSLYSDGLKKGNGFPAEKESAPSEVGQCGAGYRWFKDAPKSEEWKHSVAPLGPEEIKELTEIEKGDDLVQKEEAQEEVDSTEKPSQKVEEDDFEREVEETFNRAVEGVKLENVVLEINSLKLAYDRTFSDCAGPIFRAILNLALVAPHSTAGELLTKSIEAISKWTSLLRSYLKSEDDEIELLLKFEELCLEDAYKNFSPLFAKVVETLYDKDLVSEQAIMSWESEKAGGDEEDKKFVNQCQAFIQWLREASEEEDDEDDEEE